MKYLQIAHVRTSNINLSQRIFEKQLETKRTQWRGREKKSDWFGGAEKLNKRDIAEWK